MKNVGIRVQPEVMEFGTWIQRLQVGMLERVGNIQQVRLVLQGGQTAYPP